MIEHIAVAAALPLANFPFFASPASPSAAPAASSSVPLLTLLASALKVPATSLSSTLRSSPFRTLITSNTNLLEAHQPPSASLLPSSRFLKRLSLLRDFLESHQHVLTAAEIKQANSSFYGPLCLLSYVRSLKLLPALCRSWFDSLRDRSLIQSVTNVTATNVTPLLVEQEFDQLQEATFSSSTSSESQFKVTSEAKAQTVIAKFVSGEVNVALTLKLPSCFPLQPVTVDLPEKSCLRAGKMRKLGLAALTTLAQGTGGLRDVCQQFRDNLERMLEGVEECPICYSVVHAQSKSLPQTKCKTCNNKFHSSCLFKWFNSSGKSTCPMCRANF